MCLDFAGFSKVHSPDATRVSTTKTGAGAAPEGSQTAAAAPPLAAVKKAARQCFSILDKDSSGAIDDKEFALFMSEFDSNLTVAEVSERFRDLIPTDRKEPYLTIGDFTGWVRSMFEPHEVLAGLVRKSQFFSNLEVLYAL